MKVILKYRVLKSEGHQGLMAAVNELLDTNNSWRPLEGGFTISPLGNFFQVMVQEGER